MGATPPNPRSRLLAGLACLASAGCDAGSPSNQPLDLPPVHVTDVLAATNVDDGGALVYQSIMFPTGDAGVLSTSAFKIRFDRLLLPMTATRQAVCVQSVAAPATSAAQCGSGVSLEPSYDPVKREITYRQPVGQAPLITGVLYKLSVYAAVQDTDNGVRSMEGIPLAAQQQVNFDVASNPGGQVPPYDVLSTADHYCKTPDPNCTDITTCPRAVSVILHGCAYNGCHAGNGDASAAEGMELGTAYGLLTTAINHVSHETETGEAASTAQPAGLRFGRSMPILDPGVPGESYLVYKLLANPHNPLVLSFPNPKGLAEAPEVTRLRNAVVVGMPMPPDNGSLPLRQASSGRPDIGEAEWLSEWLLQGAPIVDKCP
jgi:hypothetical protein